MDIQFTCPECGAEGTASSYAETAKCASCGKDVAVKANKKNRLQLKGKQEKATEAADAPAPEAAAPDAQPATPQSASSVMASVQGHHAQNTRLSDPPDAPKNPEERDEEGERISKEMGARARRAILMKRIGAFAAGSIIFVGGAILLQYLATQNDSMAIWALYATVFVAGMVELGLLLTSFQAGFKHFFFVMCAQWICAAAFLGTPLPGAIGFFLVVIYRYYFVIWEVKSFFLKGAWIALPAMIYSQIYFSGKDTWVGDAMLQLVEPIKQLLK